MARRKINVKFLAILGSCLLVLGVGFLALDALHLKRFFFKVSWTTFRNAALDEESKGNLDEAAINWARAIHVKPTPDPEMRVALGDVFNRMTAKDQDNLRRAVMAWDQALQVDPTYLPAMERLLTYRSEEVQLVPRASGFEQLRALAERILAIEPRHKEANYLAAVSVVEGWMLGMETGNERVDRASESLNRIALEDPANADIPRYLASVKMGRAQDALKFNDRSGAVRLFEEAEKSIVAKVAERPGDPAILFNAARTLYALVNVDVVTGNTKRYGDLLLQYVEKADAVIRPEDKLYVDVRALHARILETQRNDIKGAEAIYREVLEKRPDEQPVRIALAEIVGRNPARRKEAVELLDRPIGQGASLVGLRGLLRPDWEVRTLITQAGLRLDDVASVRASKPDADKLFALADEAYGKIVTKIGENHAMVLRLKGRIFDAKGQSVEAIQTYSRALGLMSPTAKSDTRERLELVFLLARTYAATRQTGEAKALLTDLVAQSPRFLPGRLMLINVLLDERNVPEARRHIEYIERFAPDVAVLPNLQIAALDPQKDGEKIAKLYDKLPESNRVQMTEKARIAQRIGRPEETERLLVALRAEDPGDPEATNLLARLYLGQDKRDAAMAVFDDAMKVNPKSTVLPILRRRLEGDAPRALVADIADPFQKAMASAQIAIGDTNYSEAIGHLTAARAIKPEDKSVLDLLFRCHLGFKDWDKAAPIVEQLAKLNADGAGGLVYRCRLALSRNDLSKATDHATQLTRDYPEFSQSWLMLGQTFQAQRKFEEAVNNYQAALNKQTQNFDALQGLIESNLALGKQDEARRFIEEGLRLDPGNVTFAVMRTEWQLRFGKPEDVLAEREAALKDNPAERKNWLALTSVYRAMARNMTSSNREAEGAAFLAKARDTLADALVKFPNDLELAAQYAELCNQTGAPADGERALRTVLAALPEDVDAPLILADFQFRDDRAADAEKTLRDALVAMGNKEPLQLRLASLLFQQGKIDEAVATLDANIDRPAVIRQRVDILINARRLDDADAAITRAAGGKELTHELKSLRALVNLNQGKIDDALKLLEDVLEKEPKNSFALYYRSLARLRTGAGNLDAIIRDLSIVRDNSPTMVEVRLALVDAYRKRNDLEGAIRELESAVRQTPGDRAAILSLMDAYATAKPPRWNAAERLLLDVRALPQLAGDPQLFHAEAKMWLDRKDGARAVEAASKALAKRPADVNYLRTQFAGLLLAKQWERIMSDSQPLLGSQPQLWWLRQFRAVALKRQGDRAGAMTEIGAALDAVLPLGDWNGVGQVLQVIKTEIGPEEFLKAVDPKLAGGDPKLKIAVARVYEDQPNIAKALSLNEEALKEGASLPPADRTIALRAIERLCLLGDPQQIEKAIESLRQLIAINAADIQALNDLANLMLNPGASQNVVEGLALATRAQQSLKAAGGSSAAVDDTYGWALVLNNRVDEGVSVLQLALSKADFPDGHYHLAEAYFKLGRKQEADRSLIRAGEALLQAQQNGGRIDPSLRNMIDGLRNRIKSGA